MRGIALLMCERDTIVKDKKQENKYLQNIERTYPIPHSIINYWWNLLYLLHGINSLKLHSKKPYLGLSACHWDTVNICQEIKVLKVSSENVIHYVDLRNRPVTRYPWKILLIILMNKFNIRSTKVTVIPFKSFHQMYRLLEPL